MTHRSPSLNEDACGTRGSNFTQNALCEVPCSERLDTDSQRRLSFVSQRSAALALSPPICGRSEQRAESAPPAHHALPEQADSSLNTGNRSQRVSVH